MDYLPAIEVESASPVEASVIWLHGLGASGRDFVPVVGELNLPVGVRFIFPHAPERPVTINGGMVMPAWYDIYSMTLNREIDREQIRQSADATIDLVEREIERGVSSDKIILAGFSQGGAVVYEAALSYGKPLGGLLVLSSYFATEDSIALHSANQNIPLLVCHGTADNIVDESLGRSAVAKLTTLEYQVEYKTYPIEHSVSLPEINDISAFFSGILTAQP